MQLFNNSVRGYMALALLVVHAGPSMMYLYMEDTRVKARKIS